MLCSPAFVADDVLEDGDAGGEEEENNDIGKEMQSARWSCWWVKNNAAVDIAVVDSLFLHY